MFSLLAAVSFLNLVKHKLDIEMNTSLYPLGWLKTKWDNAVQLFLWFHYCLMFMAAIRVSTMCVYVFRVEHNALQLDSG